MSGLPFIGGMIAGGAVSGAEKARQEGRDPVRGGLSGAFSGLAFFAAIFGAILLVGVVNLLLVKLGMPGESMNTFLVAFLVTVMVLSWAGRLLLWWIDRPF